MPRSKTDLRLSRLFLASALLLGLPAVATADSDLSDLPEGSARVRSNRLATDAATLMPDESLTQRKKSVKVADLANSFKNRIEVKFSEDSGIRLRHGHLTVLPAIAKNAAATAELKQLESILDSAGNHAVARMHDLSEDNLEAMKKQGEANTGHALSNLNLWFYIYVDAGSDQELALIINQLNQLGIVEYANASTLPAPAPGMAPEDAAEFKRYWRQHNKADWPAAPSTQPGTGAPAEPLMPGTKAAPPSTTAPSPPPLATSYLSSQDYREAAPVGIDIDYVNKRYFAADGWNWGYTDVEYNWHDTHQDLSQISGNVYVNGLPSSSVIGPSYRNHGTAVIGVLSSDSNGIGTTGLVPAATVRLSTEWPATGYNPAAAVSAAASQFWWGSVILLEMQTYAGFDCNGSDSSETYVPIEWDVATKAAIKTAVANGRIVVEAAGNGNCNLDLAGFNGAFNPTAALQDSGAIIVGAGEKLTRNKASFSTYGKRVDTHAEGDWQIYTTGYGDLYNAEGEDLYYTSTFSGTSGASPIVTGAAVSLASILWEYHGSFWAPKEIRDLLRREGTKQQAGGHIGPRPDLRKQVETITNRHLQMQSADFDGDGKTDYALFRPATGAWAIRYATGATETLIWGKKGDIPAPADITGDGRAELIVFRPSTGSWYIRSWDAQQTYQPIAWGKNGDIPVPLDFNGDGKAELAFYRRRADSASLSHWYIRNWDATTKNITWGEVSDTPMARDMDGDGRDDLVVFRGIEGKWLIRNSKSGASQTIAWGQWGDIPLTYRDSLKRWNIAAWRPSDGKFYARNIHTGNTATVPGGRPGDIPRFGDSDGNGWDESIVWRPSTGVWRNLNTGVQVKWGVAGDIAIAR